MADDLNIKITVQGDPSGANQVASGLKNVESAAQGTARGATAAARETRALGKEVKEMSHLGHEAEGVLMGLERGGLGGLAQAGTNAARIIKTLATGSIGAVLIPAVIAVTAVIKILNAISEKNAEAMKSMWDAAAARSEAYKTKVDANTKELAKYYDQQRAKIQALVKEYDDLTAAIDRAEKRQKAFSEAGRAKGDADTELSKAKELAAAKTPEQREAIERKYAGKKILTDTQREQLDQENAGHEADIREQNAQDVIDKTNARLATAKAPLNKAEFDASQAKGRAEDASAYRKSVDANPNAKDEEKNDAAEMEATAARDALAAQATVKAAEAEFFKTAQEAEEIIKKATAEIQDARTEKATSGIKGQAAGTAGTAKAIEFGVDTKGEASAAGKGAAAGARGDEIEAQIKGIQDADFKSLDLGKHTDTSKLEASLAEARAAEAGAYKAIGDDSKARKAQADKIVQVLKNSRETSGS